MNRLVLHLARPVTLWSLHFIAVYALISAACAPRGLIDTDVMRAAAALLTLGVAVALLLWLLGGIRRLRYTDPDAPDRALVIGIIWTSAISLLAILANLWPIAVLSGCTG